MKDYYDVGLARTERRIDFTDYIRPVCLPSRPVDDPDFLTDDLVILSGWGLDPENNNTASSKISVESIRVNSQARCNRVRNFVSLPSVFQVN